MKKFAIILLVLVLALTLVACGGKKSGVIVETGSLVETSSADADVAGDPATETNSAQNMDNDAAMPDSWFTAE